MRRTWTQLVAPELLADPDSGDAMGHEIVDTMVEKARDWCDRNGYDMTGAPGITVTYDAGWDAMTTIEVSIKLIPRWTGLWGHVRAALDEDGLLPVHDRLEPSSPPGTPAVGDIRIGFDPAAIGFTAPTQLQWDGDRWVVLPF